MRARTRLARQSWQAASRAERGIHPAGTSAPQKWPCEFQTLLTNPCARGLKSALPSQLALPSPVGRLRRLYLEPLLQFADALQQLRQPLHGNVDPLHLPIRTGGTAEPLLAIRDAVHHAGLRLDRRAGADDQVPGYPGLPG